jgi:acyl carrier protein
VPIGVRGELYIGGEKLARGYLNRPELTAEKFLPHPLVAGERVYRTGDCVRFLPDGNIEFLGRLDHQVKLRGYRIELGEIESALRRHPEVADAVAVVRAGPGDVQQLIAYVVPVRSAAVTAAGLQEHAANWLPGPMVPASIELLDELPRTTSGKVDRHALPDPEPGRVESGGTPPRNTVEQTLSDIWCEVLALEPPGVHDNFFALGGSSLHAMQVIARFEALLGVEITLQQFFAAPTIAGLAPAVERALMEDVQSLVPGHDVEMELARTTHDAAVPAK